MARSGGPSTTFAARGLSVFLNPDKRISFKWGGLEARCAIILGFSGICSGFELREWVFRAHFIKLFRGIALE